MRILIALIIVGWIVWILRKRLTSKSLSNNSSSVENLLECAHCKTYITSKEAIFSQGRVFCSQHCLQKGN
ncbi:PP0621 family protein [Helicobacter baculiformis]|uniref:PP0621 family protein n=1 Tax=Helicobacter baculiformis TaxID=427351 RepID=A0ABV7ZIY4_9HELI|nr:PP0621 family protein [Helicobacter baculiformis]